MPWISRDEYALRFGAMPRDELDPEIAEQMWEAGFSAGQIPESQGFWEEWDRDNREREEREEEEARKRRDRQSEADEIALRSCTEDEDAEHWPRVSRDDDDEYEPDDLDFVCQDSVEYLGGDE